MTSALLCTTTTIATSISKPRSKLPTRNDSSLFSSPLNCILNYWYKYFDSLNVKKKIKKIKEHFEQMGYKVSTTDYSVRYFVINTNIVLIDENIAGDYAILREINLLWLFNNNFIFVVVDLDDIPYDFILSVEQYISKYDENKIIIYNKNNKIKLLDNYMINLPNYYGLFCKKFKCDIINRHDDKDDIELQDLRNKIIQ